MWVGVFEDGGAEEFAGLFEVVENEGVGVLNESASPVSFGSHIAFTVDELDEGGAVALANAVIVFAERGGAVDDTGAVFGGNVVVAGDEEGGFAGFFNYFVSEGVEGLVLFEFEVGAFKVFENDDFITGGFVISITVVYTGAASRTVAPHFGEFFTGVIHVSVIQIGKYLIFESSVREDFRDESGGEDIFSIADLNFDVIDFRVNAEDEVRREGPGCSSPGEIVSVGFSRFEFYDSGAFLQVLIAERDFV